MMEWVDGYSYETQPVCRDHGDLQCSNNKEEYDNNNEVDGCNDEFAYEVTSIVRETHDDDPHT